MFAIINGEKRQLPREATVLSVVQLVAADGGRSGEPAGRGVAVALDGEVVPRQEWASTSVDDGARVEVLAAIQGGSA